MLTISNDLFRGFDRFFNDDDLEFDFHIRNRRNYNNDIFIPLRRLDLQKQQQQIKRIEDLFYGNSFLNQDLQEDNLLQKQLQFLEDQFCGCTCQQYEQQQKQQQKQSPKNRFFSQSRSIRQLQDENGQIITDINEERNDNGNKNRQKQKLVHDQNSHQLLQNQKRNNEKLVEIENQRNENQNQLNIEEEYQNSLQNRQNDVIIEDEQVEQKLGESLDSEDILLQEKL